MFQSWLAPSQNDGRGIGLAPKMALQLRTRTAQRTWWGGGGELPLGASVSLPAPSLPTSGPAHPLWQAENGYPSGKLKMFPRRPDSEQPGIKWFREASDWREPKPSGPLLEGCSQHTGQTPGCWAAGPPGLPSTAEIACAATRSCVLTAGSWSSGQSLPALVYFLSYHVFLAGSSVPP